MTEIEKFELEYERKEDDQDMHFSTYFIPECYQEEESNGN